MILIGFVRGEGFFGFAAVTVGSCGCFLGSASVPRNVLVRLLGLYSPIGTLFSPRDPLKSQKYD